MPVCADSTGSDTRPCFDEGVSSGRIGRFVGRVKDAPGGEFQVPEPKFAENCDTICRPWCGAGLLFLPPRALPTRDTAQAFIEDLRQPNGSRPMP
jgi:hypothetical protein